MVPDSFDLSSYAHGIELFNNQQFYEAHEVLEDVWRGAPAEKKKFFQGLIQVAVALHHQSRGNVVGAISLLKRAGRNLAGYGEEFGGIRLLQFRGSVASCAEALEDGRPLPCIPRLDHPGC